MPLGRARSAVIWGARPGNFLSKDLGLTTLLLTRHGQTIWNSELRYQGQTDTELSDLGREQAARLAERFGQEKISAIYSSDLKRCVDTAAVLAAELGLRVSLTASLREAGYGRWEGMTYAEVRASYPDLVGQRRADVVTFIPPGGESLGQTHARVLDFLHSVAEAHPAEAVLVVTHGGPLRMFVAGVLGMPLAGALRLRVDNCSLTVCEGFPRAPTIRTLNDTCHLRGLAGAEPALGN